MIILTRSDWRIATSHQRSARSTFLATQILILVTKVKVVAKRDTISLSCGFHLKSQGVRNQKDLSITLALVEVDRTVVRPSFLTAPTTLSKDIYN